MRKNLKALLFGCVVALLLCEMVLRIYNPFATYTKQGKLVLPANQKAVFENKWISQLDKQIYYSRNSLGFRGPEPTDSLFKLNSIITIGGSTTECRFLSDSTTWPFLLGEALKDSLPNLWVNNAGIDGHSTFGHLHLLKEYILKLKPKYILLLTGVNDVETEKPESFDLMNDNRIHFTSINQFLKSVLLKTEIGSTAFQLYGLTLAYKKGLIHREIDFKHLPDTTFTEDHCRKKLLFQDSFLSGYKKRLLEITSLCKQNNIIPILLTQPSLYGSYTDPYTLTFMATKYIPAVSREANNALQGKILEKYNGIVRSLQANAKVIDLDSLFPKNSGYYYDQIHFNKNGAKKIAELLSNQLNPILKRRT